MRQCCREHNQKSASGFCGLLYYSHEDMWTFKEKTISNSVLITISHLVIRILKLGLNNKIINAYFHDQLDA